MGRGRPVDNPNSQRQGRKALFFMHYRMTLTNEFQASRMVEEACANRSDQAAATLIKKVIDAAYRSEQDMERLREILAS